MCTTFKKSKQKTPLFWDATNPLPSFSVSHPPSKSRPPPGRTYLVAGTSTSAAWPKDSSPRKRLRHLKSGASVNRWQCVVVEQPSSSMAGWVKIHGGKRCGFLSNGTSGRAKKSTKYTKMLCIYTMSPPKPTCLEGFYGI